MNEKDFLEKNFNEPELISFFDYFEPKVRPAIDIIFSDKVANLGESRLGGKPDLPLDTLWPTYQYGPYRFIGQINFSQMTLPHSLLPKDGLLSLFYAFDSEERNFWLDPDYTIGIYTPVGTPLETKETPQVLREFHPEASITIDFETTFSVPTDEWQVADNWPFEFGSYEDGIWYDCMSQLHPSGAHMLGYPRNNTLSHDPIKEGKDMLPLITLSSYEELGWCWDDGDKLVVFQDREKLLKADFSNLTNNVG